MFSDFTVACQIEGALVSAPLILQEDIVTSGIILGDLELKRKGQSHCHGDGSVLSGQRRDSETAALLKKNKKGKLLLHVCKHVENMENGEMRRTNGEVKGVNLWQQRLCPDFGSWWRWIVPCGLLFPLFFFDDFFFLLLNNPLWIRQICKLMQVRMMGLAVKRPTEAHAVTPSHL